MLERTALSMRLRVAARGWAKCGEGEDTIYTMFKKKGNPQRVVDGAPPVLPLLCKTCRGGFTRLGRQAVEKSKARPHMPSTARVPAVFVLLP